MQAKPEEAGGVTSETKDIANLTFQIKTTVKKPHTLRRLFKAAYHYAAGTFVRLDKVTLRLILVSGRTHEFQFHPLTPAHEVTQKVFEQWPKEWADEKVESASMLKLIYHGRFLHGSVTLNALNLPQDSLSKRKRGGCCRCVLS
ncbi:hypothetical protein ANCCEY_04411 [Ancylostoma ceylanicum]|uniref:UBL3-like ubiquitin domain-containing protein n=1 Tax=Ancylostoma ceylanicum TaxID=53326 RepID=A0A0D6M2G0_9BILA|nr:hypothetical protein ANCCEY_04411 [Ancylostoma ceylanicum]